MANDCNMCVYYGYDEDTEEYYCTVDMDEDDYIRFITDRNFNCPYFNKDDEYGVVRHQN